jgi:hypothetical protein
VTRTSLQRPTWLGISAAYLALFLLVGLQQVLPALHFTLVAHRLCADHGELLHEAGGDERLPLASSPEVALVSADAAGHEHEHCGVLALPPSLAALEKVGGAVALLPAPWALCLPDTERAAHVDIALLSYAPKLAPPV